MPCPCGNDPGAGVPYGCRSSPGFGSMLGAGGCSSVLSDDLRLILNGKVPSMAVVLWGVPRPASASAAWPASARVPGASPWEPLEPRTSVPDPRGMQAPRQGKRGCSRRS